MSECQIGQTCRYLLDASGAKYMYTQKELKIASSTDQ